MTDVFLSYSREDQRIARHFATGLEREGLGVWWDQALNAGEAFDRVTEKALGEARTVVVLWSKHSVDSDWVRAEATQARATGRLVPVMIEPCKRPIMFELTHTADLEGWNGDNTDSRWRTFIDGLRRVAGGSTAALAGTGASPSMAATTQRPVPAPRRRIGWVAAAAAAIGLAGGLLWHLYGRPAPVVEASIAVLPFDDLSPGKDQGYFADGVAEEILNKLARIPDPDLRVTARNSSFAFRDQDKDMRTIGQTLGVAHLLEGSLRKSGDQLRITAQLIRADTGFHLWSQTYERPLTDVFMIQEDIATKVAQALQVKLGVGLGQQPGMTRNVDAYEAYLGATAVPQQFTVNGEQRRIELLQRAVNLDPDFAAAWLAMSGSYISMIGIVGRAGAQEWIQKSQAAFREYERILPDSPVHYIRRAEASVEEGHWTQALTHYQSVAAAAERIGAVGYRNFADGGPAFNLRVGRPRVAIASFEQAKASDPLSQNVAFALAWSYGSAGDFQAAFREYERGDTLAPTERFRLRSTAAMLALGINDRVQLQRWLDATVETSREIPGFTGFYGKMRDLLDRPDEALALLHAELPKATPNAKSGYAVWFAWHGDTQGALEALRQGLQPGSMSVTAFTVWAPGLREVRKLEGFKQLMRDAGLVDYWKQYGWGDFCKPVGDDDFECH
jgi:TolB-like protein